MIKGIGIDSVEIARFEAWHSYSQKQLKRIFSSQEIAYCLQNSGLSAQRFAVRFAAREALYKALTTAAPGHTIPFLTLCRATTILKSPAPFLELDWPLFTPYINLKMVPNWRIFLSLTHTRGIATAIVILESPDPNGILGKT